MSFNNESGTTATGTATPAYDTALGASVPASPTLTGYTFAGWYSDFGLTTPYTFTTMPASSFTLYAAWTINTYTLAYTAGAHKSIVDSATQVVNYGGSGTAVTATPATGYHFVNWPDGVLTATRTDTNVSGNMTVTALFAANALTKLATKLTITSNKTTVYRGQTITFSGTIMPNTGERVARTRLHTAVRIEHVGACLGSQHV